MTHFDAKILVVDDDPLLLDLLVDTLQSIGYKATSATDGQHALEKLKKSRFDLVITDIKMPNMDGLNLLKKMRHRYPQIPVLFITGVTSPEVIAMAKPDGLLAKPFRISHVEELIESALSRNPNQVKRTVSRILILDDDEKTRQSLSDSLAVSRYLPFAVNNDDAALQEIENGSIDAVIASLDPTHENSYRILNQIRLKKPKLPVIVLGPESSNKNELTKDVLQQLDGYFPKPVAAEELINLLDSIIPNEN